MAQIGSFALILALGLSFYSFAAGLLSLFGHDAASARLGETARRAGIATFIIVLLAAFILVAAAFNDDFSIAYIYHHSNRDLPAAYKFAVLWSGQEGSLLFWSLLLAGYGFVLRLRYKTDQRLFAYASVVIAAEIARGGFAAQVTVDALVIDVVLAGQVFRVAICNVSHKFIWGRGTIYPLKFGAILFLHFLRAVARDSP